MIAAMIAMTLSAAPVVIQIDLQDALRFPSGVESPPANPLQIFVKAPASWLTAKGISEAGKKEVLARLYGDPNWMNGNSDGSTYVVKSFASKVIAAAPENPKAYWYEVNASGVIEKKGPSFGEPIAPKAPTSLIDQAERVAFLADFPGKAVHLIAQHIADRHRCQRRRRVGAADHQHAAGEVFQVFGVAGVALGAAVEQGADDRRFLQ